MQKFILGPPGHYRPPYLVKFGSFEKESPKGFLSAENLKYLTYHFSS